MSFAASAPIHFDQEQQGRITDVPGVAIGHRTLVSGDTIRTGVTAIVPHPVPTPDQPLPCGFFVGNGHGKMVGATQVEELGALETPIVLTNTLSVFRAADALTRWMLRRPDCASVTTLNPVAAECNDSWLSDIRAQVVGEDDVYAALDAASADGPDFDLGAVGAGTGMRALGFKGGIGTASRTTAAGHVVGVLALTNFTGELVWEGQTVPAGNDAAPQGNSCVLVVATNAPLDARQLTRIARRAVFAMGTVGAYYSHGSGDYGIAFSTQRDPAPMADRDLDPLFTATLAASSAAIMSSLWHARTTVGRDGHTALGLRETLRDRQTARS